MSPWSGVLLLAGTAGAAAGTAASVTTRSAGLPRRSRLIGLAAAARGSTTGSTSLLLATDQGQGERQSEDSEQFTHANLPPLVIGASPARAFPQEWSRESPCGLATNAGFIWGRAGSIQRGDDHRDPTAVKGMPPNPRDRLFDAGGGYRPQRR